VNQKSSSQNVTCRVEDAKINAAASGWGKREFIKLDSIRTDSGFIDGDKLIIRCQMHAVDTVFWEVLIIKLIHCHCALHCNIAAFDLIALYAYNRSTISRR
jgi:hypothetical protein